jgi:hypothetical protein
MTDAGVIRERLAGARPSRADDRRWTAPGPRSGRRSVVLRCDVCDERVLAQSKATSPGTDAVGDDVRVIWACAEGLIGRATAARWSKKRQTTC